MKTLLRAKSSSGEPYEVVFEIEDCRVRVECNCKAGQLGQLCKHVKSLIDGDSSMLSDTLEDENLKALCGEMAKTNLYREIAEFEKQIEELDKAKTAIELQRKQIKGMFARRLRQGI